jgi:hypothetical protein
MPPRVHSGSEEESRRDESSLISGLERSAPQNPLTSTPEGLHCVSTQEADEIMVNAFLDALAEVALSVAARSIAQDKTEGQEE